MDPSYLQDTLGPVFEHIAAMETGIELDLSRIESSGDLKQDLFNLKVFSSAFSHCPLLLSLWILFGVTI
jgi:hypothetical protein